MTEARQGRESPDPSPAFTEAVGAEGRARTDLEAATAALRRATAALRSAEDRARRAAAHDAELSAIHDKTSAALRAAAAALADVERRHAGAIASDTNTTAEIRQPGHEMHEAKRTHDSALEADTRAAAAHRDSAAALDRAMRRTVADEGRTRDAVWAVSQADQTLAEAMAITEHAAESLARLAAYVTDTREKAARHRIDADRARWQATQARQRAEELIEAAHRARSSSKVSPRRNIPDTNHLA
jgi:hypothetical protein